MTDINPRPDPAEPWDGRPPKGHEGAVAHVLRRHGGRERAAMWMADEIAAGHGSGWLVCNTGGLWPSDYAARNGWSYVAPLYALPSTPDAARERVARAICAADGMNPDADVNTHHAIEAPRPAWTDYTPHADAVLALTHARATAGETVGVPDAMAWERGAAAERELIAVVFDKAAETIYKQYLEARHSVSCDALMTYQTNLRGWARQIRDTPLADAPGSTTTPLTEKPE